MLGWEHLCLTDSYELLVCILIMGYYGRLSAMRGLRREPLTLMIATVVGRGGTSASVDSMLLGALSCVSEIRRLFFGSVRTTWFVRFVLMELTAVCLRRLLTVLVVVVPLLI